MFGSKESKKTKDRGEHTSHCIGLNFGHMRQLSLGESSSPSESDLTGESAEREYLETCEQRAVREGGHLWLCFGVTLRGY